MTDNDIIKALESIKYRTDGIVTRGYYFDPETFEQVVDLVNRQKAEIERLEKQSNVLAKRFYKEGIQDLAQKLQEKAYIPKPYGMKEVIDVCDIYELVIALVGERDD